jgi:predicted DNA-binding transcriptional regulator AlpA
MPDGSGRRPARFVRKPEVARVLQVSIKTVDRMIRRGELPKPVNLTNGSVTFPLEELVAWWRVRSDKIAFEFESLAYTPAEKPEAIEEALAKRLSRQYGERFTPDQVVYGAARDASPEEADAIRAAMIRQADESGARLFGELDFIEALLVAYGFFPALRDMITAMIEVLSERKKIPMPALPNDKEAHLVSLGVLAAAPAEREHHRKKLQMKLEARKALAREESP